MFDEENAPEGYRCACGGSILLYDGMWCCDKCDFEAPDNRNTKTNKSMHATEKGVAHQKQ